MSKFRLLSLTAPIAAANFVAVSSAQAQEVVRLGNLKFAHYGAVSYIKEIAPKCDIKVEEHVFAKGPDVMQAILAGELDVGATASEAAISGRANGAPIYVVAGFAKGGARLVARPDCNITASGRKGNLSRSIAVPCRNPCLKAKSSVTRRAHSPARKSAASASWSSRRAAPCSLMRSRACRWGCRSSCCGCCRRRLERLGANDSVALACTIVAATKVDLLQLSAQGQFREDLYYRIGVVNLDLPRLNQRREDIPLLLAHFAADAAARYQRPLPAWSPQQMAQWQAAEWPGNVRELRNFAERLVLGIAGSVLGAAPAEVGAPLSLPQRVDQYERELIAQALAAVDGNVALAADNLMVPRKTLYDKLKKYQIGTGRK